MTYEEALRYLDSFVNYERRDGYDYKSSFRLDRMLRLASGLGNPQKKYRSVHVAGTKGKGSTSAIVHSILKEAGYKAGLYTSPHLASFRERINIGGELISAEDVGRILERIKSVVETMKDDIPTFFEVYTALAYLYFKEKKVDLAVFEVGLGGRLDATNILEPLVSVITPISYEHTDRLGDTLTQIAGEKAGIIKTGSVCVVAPQTEEALSVIIKVCNDKGAKAILVGKDIKFKELDFNDSIETFAISGLFNNYPRLEMSLLGAHQVANAATAIGAVEALHFSSIDINKGSVSSGVRNARWPGRLEVISKRPYIIVDGAQNRASANALVKAVERAFKYNRLILVLGVSKDKDIKGILEELVPAADKIILTKSKVPERAALPAKIKELMSPGDKDIYLTNTVEEAIARARSFADPEDLILITGSLFVVGEAMQASYA
jgi:dihydrofolate synthase/folylpolyglutamate synthase